MADTDASSNFAAPGEPRFEVLEIQTSRGSSSIPGNVAVAFNELVALGPDDIKINTSIV
jgi:hypothetical protein